MSSLSLSLRLQNSATEQCNNPRYENKMKAETREVPLVLKSHGTSATELRFEVVVFRGFDGGESLSKRIREFPRTVDLSTFIDNRFGRENGERKRNKSRKLVIECLSSVAKRSALFRDASKSLFQASERARERERERDFPLGKSGDATPASDRN